MVCSSARLLCVSAPRVPVAAVYHFQPISATTVLRARVRLFAPLASDGTPVTRDGSGKIVEVYGLHQATRTVECIAYPQSQADHRGVHVGLRSASRHPSVPAL